jgi:lipopolysaccharide transport system ATP-binding protein
MYVRLAFSVAAHLEPEILVIDEVLAVGDSDFQQKCIGKMKSIANSGRTVLFVSHNMPAVKKLCSKCIHLQKGEITYFGDVQIAIEKYIGNTKTNNSVNTYDIDQKREGNGNIKFIKSVIKNNLNEITNKLIIGNSFTLHLEFNTLKELNSNDIMFLVSISDDQGFRLTYFKKKLDIRHIKNNSIECKIINPPLNTGLYFFNIALKCNNELEDWIINAANIEIMDSSLSLSENHVNHTEKSPIIIANKWK